MLKFHQNEQKEMNMPIEGSIDFAANLGDLGSSLKDSVAGAGILTHVHKLSNLFKYKYPNHANPDSNHTKQLYLLETQALGKSTNPDFIINLKNQLQKYLQKFIGEDFVHTCLDVIRSVSYQNVYEFGDVLHTYLTINSIAEEHLKEKEIDKMIVNLTKQIKIYLTKSFFKMDAIIIYILEHKIDLIKCDEKINLSLFKEVTQDMYREHQRIISTIIKDNIIPKDLKKNIKGLGVRLVQEIEPLIESGGIYTPFNIYNQEYKILGSIYNDNIPDNVLKILKYCDKMFFNLDKFSFKRLLFKVEYEYNNDENEIVVSNISINKPLLSRIYYFISWFEQYLNNPNFDFNEKNTSLNYDYIQKIQLYHHNGTSSKEIMEILNHKYPHHSKFYKIYYEKIAKILSIIFINNNYKNK